MCLYSKGDYIFMKTYLIVLLFASASVAFSQSIYRQWENGYGPKDMVLVEKDDYVIAYFISGSEAKLARIESSTGLLVAEVPVKPNPKWYSHTNLLLNTKDDNTIIYMTGDSNNTGFYLEYYKTSNLELIKRKHCLYDTSFANTLFGTRIINFTRSIIDSKNQKLYTVIKKDLVKDTSLVLIYDVERGLEINRIPYEFGNDEQANIALSPDESRLVTFSTGLEYIKVWNLKTMELITSFPSKKLQTPANNFTSPVDVRFSTLDPDIIYILGARSYQRNIRRGIFKYSTSRNNIIKEISQGLEIDTQKLIFFDDEKRVLRFNERILNIFNLNSDSSEYFKPWGYTLPVEMNVLYSDWHDLFIVSGNNNMYGIRYTRPEISGIDIIPSVNYSISPNPATTKLSVNLSDGIIAKSYRITDMSGKLLLTGYLLPSGSVSLDIGNIPVGVYMIEIEATNGDMIIDKFVKE